MSVAIKPLQEAVIAQAQVVVELKHQIPVEVSGKGPGLGIGIDWDLIRSGTVAELSLPAVAAQEGGHFCLSGQHRADSGIVSGIIVIKTIGKKTGTRHGRIGFGRPA